MANPGISIPKPRGLRPESSKRIRGGPYALSKKSPRKLAAGMKYGKARHC